MSVIAKKKMFKHLTKTQSFSSTLHIPHKKFIKNKDNTWYLEIYMNCPHVLKK